VALDVCRLCNDEMASAAALHPGRFHGLASLPMQDTSAALEELDRAINTLGLVGVQLLTNVNGINIFDRRFYPVLERIHELSVPIFIHPYGCLNEDRMSEGFLANVVGFPSELAVTGAGFILNGLLDDLPDLKILLGHGGGSFLYLLGRISRGYEAVAALREKLRKAPRDYLSNFHVDTVLHDEQALRYAEQTIGSDRICFGTDWPFWMQDPDMPARLERVPGLSADDWARIRYANAARLFNLVDAQLEPSRHDVA
jgi:aminocarboxymuconate-semialdehyde decarboxylase